MTAMQEQTEPESPRMEIMKNAWGWDLLILRGGLKKPARWGLCCSSLSQDDSFYWEVWGLLELFQSPFLLYHGFPEVPPKQSHSSLGEGAHNSIIENWFKTHVCPHITEKQSWS